MKRTLAILVAAVLFLGMFAIAASALPANLGDYEVTFIDVETGDVFDPGVSTPMVGQTIRMEYNRKNPLDTTVQYPVTEELFVWYVTNPAAVIEGATVVTPTKVGTDYTFGPADFGKTVVAAVISDNTITGKYEDPTNAGPSLDQYIGGFQFGNPVSIVTEGNVSQEFFNALQELVMAKLVKDENYGTLVGFGKVQFRTLVENAEDTDLQDKLDAAWAAFYALVNRSPAATTLTINTLINNFQKAIKALKDSTKEVIDLQMSRTQGKLQALLNSLKALQALDRLNEESTYKLTVLIAKTTDALSWTNATIRSYNQYTKTWGAHPQLGATSIATLALAPATTGVPGAILMRTKLDDARTAQEWLMDLWTSVEDSYLGEFARDVLEVADAAALKAAEEAAKAAEADKAAAEAAAKAAQDLADELRKIIDDLQKQTPKIVAIDGIYNFFAGLIGGNFFTDVLTWITRNLLFGWLWSPIKYVIA